MSSIARRLSKRRLIQLIADFVVLVAAFLLAVAFRGIIPYPLFGVDPTPYVRPELLMFLGLSLIFLLIFDYNSLYHLNVFLTSSRQVALTLRAMMWSLFVYAAFTFAIARHNSVFESRLIFLNFAALSTLMLVLTRVFVLRPAYLLLMRRSHKLRAPVAIVGGGDTACRIATRILTESQYGLRLAGFVTDQKKKGEAVFQDVPSLGTIDHLQEIVSRYRLKQLIIAPDSDETPEVLATLAHCRSIPHVKTFVTSPIFNVVSHQFPVEELRDTPLIPAASNRAVYIIIKRAVDLIGASILVVLLSPLMAAIALAVRLSSSGPIIFAQERVGRDGNKFRFFKFRSMYVNNDATNHKKFVEEFIKGGDEENEGASPKKIVNDPRVTPIGRWIRKLSLDELPQLFNVLRGDMSLVGPRPCLPYEYEMYEVWHRHRLSVTPGCTGFWQVYGRSKVSFHDMVVMDLFYIENMSLWFDLHLLFKTVPAMVAGKGAY